MQGGDTGEFALVAVRGAVAHPPGYPLYAMLSRAWTAVLPGEPFLRIALLSALLGASGAAVLQRALARLTGDETVSLLAALAFALSPLAWRASTLPEVFALATLLASTCLLASTRLVDATPEATPRASAWLGLACGLALANQHTAVLAAPIAIHALVVAIRRDGRVARVLVPFAAAALAGLLPYVWLPIAARTAGPHAWIWGDTSSAEGLASHVLRRDYGTLRLGVEGAERAPLARIVECLVGVAAQWTWIWAVPGIAGAIVLWKRQRGLALAWAASFALSAVVFPSLVNLPRSEIASAVVARFHLLPAQLFAVPVAFGMARLLAWRRALGTVLLLLPFPLAVLGGVNVHAPSSHAVERYFHAALREVERDAVIVGQGDMDLFAIGWLLDGREERPDVEYLDANLVRHRWYYDRACERIPELAEIPFDGERTRLTPILEALSKTRPTYATMQLAPLVGAAFDRWPEGFFARIEPVGTARPPAAELEVRLARATSALPPPRRSDDAWARSVRLQAAVPWKVLAEEWTREGAADRAAEARRKQDALVLDASLQYATRFW